MTDTGMFSASIKTGSWDSVFGGVSSGDTSEWLDAISLNISSLNLYFSISLSYVMTTFQDICVNLPYSGWAGSHIPF
ncbi:hypothetical protein J3M38_25200 [Citrobacter freundii]|uniref:hypothetical protein n=1 Tax=Citrobacter freundii TaxID=546 RepID=UPI001782E2A4|nr:hypothetical protein [Citrobacter freundii]MBD5760531.1 hypothetical protein [Citrobacter freundii]MCK2062190.1 hypothetical protein [Citrobacter freundii]MDN4223537.1 hypothetical protein [Citrobacter freundii]